MMNRSGKRSLRSLAAVAAASALIVPLFSACGATDNATDTNRGAAEAVGAAVCADSGALCEGRDFRGWDLRGATFESSILNGARFDGANLEGATFVGTSLQGTSWQSPDGGCRLPFNGAHAQCATDYGWATFDAPLKTLVSASYGTTGTGDFSGDGGPVTAAKFSGPTGVAISDDDKTIYIADSRNHRVRAVDVASGTITTFAGSGRVCTFDIDRCGDGNAATTADLSEPVGLAYDGPDKKLFIADQGASMVRAVDLTDNTISTVAGNGRLGYSGDGGPSEDARLAKPAGLTYADGKLYISDLANNSVRTVTLDDGTIDRLVGSATGKPCSESSPCGDHGEATDAKLDSPNDVAVNSAGYVAIADTRDRAIRLIAPDGSIRSLISGFKGNQDSEDSEDPRPSFVDFDRNDNLYVGPLKGGKLGRIPAAAIATNEQLNWSSPIASVPGLGAGSLMSIDPHDRYIVVTDPASQQVRLIVSDVGPNLKDVKFVNAAIGPRYTVDQSGVRTSLTGVINQNTSFDNVNLDWAKVKDSVLPASTNLVARKISATNTTFGKLNKSDISYADLDSVNGLNATDTCIRNATLKGTLSDWNLDHSTLQGATADSSSNKVTFNNLTATKSSIANTTGNTKWTYDHGSLNQVSFYNVAQTLPEIDFTKTTLANVPVKAGGGSPDQTKHPANWAETDTTAGCKSDPYSANAKYTQAIEWGTYWGKNRENRYMVIQSKFGIDDQGELRTGDVNLSSVPLKTNGDPGATYITMQSEDGNRLLEIPATKNGLVDLTPIFKELHDKGTPLIIRPGSSLHFNVRNEQSLFDPAARGSVNGQSSEFPVPQGDRPLVGQVTLTGHLDGAGLGKSHITVRLETDGKQRLNKVSLSSDQKEKNLQVLVVDPATKMSAPEDYRSGSLSQLTLGQNLETKVWSTKDGAALNGSMTIFDPNEPDAVDNLTATNQGNGLIRVSWVKRNDGHLDPENYVVTATPGGKTCTAAGSATSCDFPDMAPTGTDTTYTFAVQANRANYHRDLGTTKLQIRDPNLPSLLTNFAAAYQGNGVVKVTWQRPSDLSNPPDSYVVTAAPGGVNCTVAGTADGCELKGMAPGKGQSVKYTITAVANRGDFHPQVGSTELQIDALTADSLRKELDAKIVELKAERDQKIKEAGAGGELDRVTQEVMSKTPSGPLRDTQMFAEFDKVAVDTVMKENGLSESQAREQVNGIYDLVDKCAYPGWRDKTAAQVLTLFYLSGDNFGEGSSCKFGELIVASIVPSMFLEMPQSATQFGILVNQLADAMTSDQAAVEQREQITKEYNSKIDAVTKEYDKRIADLKD